MSPPETMRLRVLVVDDEAPARKRLTQLLGKDPQVTEVLEATDGMAALEMIQTHRPDIVFLDVQMPYLDGFGVIQALGAKEMPHTVFVTAYDDYAVRAFDADAVDYLVKPFGDARFLQALTRVKTRLRNREPVRFGPHVMEAGAQTPAYWDRLVVKMGGVVRLVLARDIDWIEAADVYVNLHVGGKEILYRAALGQFAAKLNPSLFVRIQRSLVVNIERIKELEPVSHGGFEVILKDGTRLQLSRNYRPELEKRLGQSL